MHIAGAKKKILIVEDERDLASVVRMRLEASGYNVIIAHDGQNGLDIARREKPDLMILDVMLPKMDGYKVCALLKTDMRFNAMPVILFTAKFHESDIRIGEEVCADAYITKPFDPGELLEKIRELLEKRGSDNKEISS